VFGSPVSSAIANPLVGKKIVGQGFQNTTFLGKLSVIGSFARKYGRASLINKCNKFNQEFSAMN
jgi:hypothetical protein